MNLIERLDRDCPPCSVNQDRIIERIDQPWLGDGRVLASRRRFQAIAKARANTRHGLGVRVDRDPLALRQCKTAQVIDAVNMIGMGMGVDHGIKTVHLVDNHLLAEIRSGVDRDRGFTAIRSDLRDQERSACPAVFRVLRITGAPIAIDPRHAR